MKIYNFRKSINKENLKGYQLRYSKSKQYLAKASGGEDMVEISPQAMEQYITRLHEELNNINKREIIAKYLPVIESQINDEDKDLNQIKNKINEDYYSNEKILSIASDKILKLLMY